MDIQSAWEKRDLDPVRGVLHQNLYQQTNRQIEKKIEDGIVNHLERISINTAYLTSYRRDRQCEDDLYALCRCEDEKCQGGG